MGEVLQTCPVGIGTHLLQRWRNRRVPLLRISHPAIGGTLELLGRPIFFTEYAKTLGDEGDPAVVALAANPQGEQRDAVTDCGAPGTRLTKVKRPNRI